ncbi:MAG: hypothetical protein IJ684_05230 [Bacteroidales bacterium]|nr:hypothetical protein [Bacteroidales bacterium]
MHSACLSAPSIRRRTARATAHVLWTFLLCFSFHVSAQPHATGIDNGVVYLNDLEEHSWSYYSDVDCPIHSLRPVDVKVSYFGAGNKQMYTSTGADPSGEPVQVNTSEVKVGIASGEDQHTFVYYKTLERTDGATATSPTGRCPYRVIPNPFSVRPTFTSGGTRYYTGFYRWRLKQATGDVYRQASGGTALEHGALIEADETLYLETDSTYMELELEALWARAYVKTDRSVQNVSVGVERNFVVLTSAGSYNLGSGSNGISNSNNRPFTVTSIYPNGTTNGSTQATEARSGTYFITASNTLTADTKVEYIALKASSYTLTCNGHNFVLGRGVSGKVKNICGGVEPPSNKTVSNTFNFTLRLESGSVDYLYMLYNSQATYSSTVETRCILGCDYDRATGDNTHLDIAPSGDIYGSLASTFNNSSQRNRLTFDWYIKSGRVQRNVTIDNYLYMGTTNQSGAQDGVKYCGRRRLTIEGGDVGTISGGINCYGNSRETYKVNEGWPVLIRMTGGTVRGAIYGAATYAGASGDRRFIITGGQVKGWVAGGCNGTQTTGGELYGNTELYVGGTARIDSEGSTTTIGSSQGGNIFGAGSGIANGTTVGRVDNSTVVVADSAVVERDVYGGGNLGYVRSGGSTHVHILGGTVNGKVFGGSNQQQGQQVTITMRGGTVLGGVYGGSNQSGTVAGPVLVEVLGGTVGKEATSTNPEVGNVFGCGYGASTRVTGNVEVVVGSRKLSLRGVHQDLPEVWGSVYGGGHNAPYTSSGKTFSVKTYNGLLHNHIFGGGKGSTAVITGDTDVHVMGATHVRGNVYGGGNAGKVTGDTHVKVGEE